MKKATCWTDVDEEKGIPVFCIRAPYLQPFTDQIKRDIPRSARWFDGTRKIWCVELAYKDAALEVVREHYEEVAIAPEYDPKVGAEVTELRAEIARLKQQLQYAQASTPSAKKDREIARLQTELLGAKSEAELLRQQNLRLRQQAAMHRLGEEFGIGKKKEERSPYEMIAAALSKEDLKRLYRMAILASHPDKVGGNTRLAQDVNIAWDKICKEKGI